MSERVDAAAHGEWELRARHATVAGSAVQWRMAGDGPPVVLVHGLSGSWRWWRPVLAPLARSHEIHLVDLPRAAALARGSDGDTVDWLAAWLEAAALERASVIGHSLGGFTAACLAARHPERIERLVLAAPVGVPTGRRFVGYGRPLALSLARSQPRFLRTLAGDALRTGPASLLRGALDATRADLRGELAGIRAPTLLVWGERDPLVPSAVADAWSAGLRDARVAVVPGAAHVPMWERPDDFAATVLGFLEEALDERSDPPRG